MSWHEDDVTISFTASFLVSSKGRSAFLAYFSEITLEFDIKYFYDEETGDELYRVDLDILEVSSQATTEAIAIQEVREQARAFLIANPTAMNRLFP